MQHLKPKMTSHRNYFVTKHAIDQYRERVGRSKSTDQELGDILDREINENRHLGIPIRDKNYDEPVTVFTFGTGSDQYHPLVRGGAVVTILSPKIVDNNWINGRWTKITEEPVHRPDTPINTPFKTTLHNVTPVVPTSKPLPATGATAIASARPVVTEVAREIAQPRQPSALELAAREVHDAATEAGAARNALRDAQSRLSNAEVALKTARAKMDEAIRHVAGIETPIAAGALEDEEEGARTRRNHTDDFKRQVVAEYRAGLGSQLEIAKRHDISPSLVTSWVGAGRFG